VKPLQRLRQWIHVRSRPADYDGIESVSSISKVPDDPGRQIFVVGPSDAPKWVVFNCPCNKSHRLSVPLMKSITPHWRMSRHGRSLSLYPSVWVDSEGVCGSHFWLRSSRIDWARSNRTLKSNAPSTY
jgi:hypothetical protein